MRQTSVTATLFVQRARVVHSRLRNPPPTTLRNPAHPSAVYSNTTTAATTTRRFSSKLPSSAMASDADYMSFLDKANQDPSQGVAKQQGGAGVEFKTTDSGAQVPEPLVAATKEAFYTSDADEPFVPVALGWEGGLPDEESLARLIGHPDPAKAEVEIQDPVDWDSQGRYKAIIDAVRNAGKGNDVRVYRIAKGSVKAEYWVLTTDGKGKGAKLLGAKALAVES